MEQSRRKAGTTRTAARVEAQASFEKGRKTVQMPPMSRPGNLMKTEFLEHF